MPIGAVPLSTTQRQDLPVSWSFLAAGTYDLVTLDPTGGKRTARQIVAMVAGTWTIEDYAGTSNASVAVYQGFVHVGATRGITTSQPIAVYW